MGRTAKWVAGAAVVAVGIAAGLVARERAHQRERFEVPEAEFAKHAERVLPRYLADAEALAKDPFFRTPHPDKDAGPFLNPRLPLAPELRAAVDANAAPRAFELDAALETDFRNWGGDWLRHFADPDVMHADPSWLEALDEYGYWDPLAGRPEAELQHRGLTHAPGANYAVLLRWAQVRILKGRRTGDFTRVGRELHQLAWLSLSTEQLPGAIVAIKLLELERDSRVALAKAGLDVIAWEAPAPELVGQLDRVVWGSVALSQVWLPDAVLSKALEPAPGRCLAITEHARQLGVRKAAGLPVSEVYEKQLSLTEPPCRLTTARWQLAEPFNLAALKTVATGTGRPFMERTAVRLFPTLLVEQLEEAQLAPATRVLGALEQPTASAN